MKHLSLDRPGNARVFDVGSFPSLYIDEIVCHGMASQRGPAAAIAGAQSFQNAAKDGKIPFHESRIARDKNHGGMGWNDHGHGSHLILAIRIDIINSKRVGWPVENVLDGSRRFDLERVRDWLVPIVSLRHRI